MKYYCGHGEWHTAVAMVNDILLWPWWVTYHCGHGEWHITVAMVNDISLWPWWMTYCCCYDEWWTSVAMANNILVWQWCLCRSFRSSLCVPSHLASFWAWVAWCLLAPSSCWTRFTIQVSRFPWAETSESIMSQVSSWILIVHSWILSNQYSRQGSQLTFCKTNNERNKHAKVTFNIGLYLDIYQPLPVKHGKHCLSLEFEFFLMTLTFS